METEPQSGSPPVPDSWQGRALYVLVTLVLPIVCFIASPMLRPEWQSGKTSDYAALLLDPAAAVLFFPLLLYSMVCMGLLLIAPQRYVPHFLIRFGIYCGVFLALQYVILLAFALTIPALIADGVFFGLWLLSWWVKTKFGQRGMQVFGSLIVIGGLVLFGLSILEKFRWSSFGFEEFQRNLWSTLSSLPFFTLVVILMLAPCFCLSAMSLTAFKLIKSYETSLLTPIMRSLGWLAWLGGMASAWRFSVLKMFEIYASLPPAPPDCYIATAAARGHKLLVQSQPVALSTGLLWVNPQLQTLKCAELALLALAPALHHALRRIYDVAGQALARRLTHPILADMAYVSLKPVEWLARWVLKAVVPEIEEYARGLYRAN